MSSIEATQQDSNCRAEWRALLERLLPPLRYVWHGFQMMAAYVGQMAPAGRLTLVAMFQAADEMRRIHRIAHRMAQLRHQPDFGARALAHWQEAPPGSRCGGRWSRSWSRTTGANRSLPLPVSEADDRPPDDRAGPLARERQDFFLGEFLTSLDEDCRWHRDWADALVRLLAQSPDNTRPPCGAGSRPGCPAPRQAVRALASCAEPGARRRPRGRRRPCSGCAVDLELVNR